MRSGLIKKVLSLSAVAVIFAACAPSPKQLQKTLEEHPEILVGAFEKNPAQLMEAIQKAAEASRGAQQANAEKAEKERTEKEFANPLVAENLDGRVAKGPANAPVTIVEYTDFQCPFCARGYQTMEQVVKAYGDQVRIIVKHLPLPNHPMAVPAAKRYEAIAKQDHKKALAFYSEVFSKQDKLNQDQEKFLDAAAKKVGADVAKMKKDMESPEVGAIIQADMAEAQKFGINGTPGFIVGGVSVKGAYPFETFKGIIDRRLAEKK